MTIAKEDVDLHHKEEMELTCPWCQTHTITASVNHRTLRLRCNECNMDAFVIQHTSHAFRMEILG